MQDYTCEGTSSGSSAQQWQWQWSAGPQCITVPQDFQFAYTLADNKKMDKYYRVKKDTATWEVGAVLQNKGDNGGYMSVNDFYDKPCIEGIGYHETKKVVENSPEFFERVYPVSLLTKTVYRLKEEARELFTKEHQA